MTTDYKPLTPEQITAAGKEADCALLLKDYSFSMPAFARAIERAAIENYLAQHLAHQDAELLQALRHELALIETDPDSELSNGAERTIRWALTQIDAAIAAAKGK